MGSVLLITFEVFVLHIVPDPLCTSIGSIVFKCEGKDTNKYRNTKSLANFFAISRDLANVTGRFFLRETASISSSCR